MSTVAGELRPDVGWPELLAATFPAGSITGAPKLAAMAMIDRLETGPEASTAVPSDGSMPIAASAS